MTIIACDIGTSALKVTVLNFEAAAAGGELLAGSARHAYPTRYGAPGCVEQHPGDWLDALASCIDRLHEAENLNGAEALVFTGQMSAGLIVSPQAVPLSECLIWSDTRASEEIRTAGARISPAAFYRLTGNPLDVTYSGAKIGWLIKRAASVPAGARFLQPKDWLTMRLCGRAVMDKSDASCTGLLDIRAGKWDDTLFSAFDIPRRLAPDLVEATEVVGAVRADAPGPLAHLAGLPIVAGGGDGPTSSVGAGASQAGDAYVSLGTSAWLSFLSCVPVDDRRRRLFSYRHVIPGLFTVTGSTQNGGGLVDWLLRDMLRRDDDRRAAIASALEQVQPGCDGLVMLPYLQGERTPYWNSRASGVFFGLRTSHGQEHMLRAVLEALCLQMRLIADTFAELGFSADEMGLIGGLAEDAGIVTLLARTMQKRFAMVRRPGEATAIGAGLVAALGLGLISHPADVARYVHRESGDAPAPRHVALEENYALFKSLYARLEPLFRP